MIYKPLSLIISSHVKDGIPEEQKYGIIDRNYTPFRSNVQRRRGMYLVMIERRLRRRDKDVGAESDLLNDLGFNLCVAPRSPVMGIKGNLILRQGWQQMGIW